MRDWTHEDLWPGPEPVVLPPGCWCRNCGRHVDDGVEVHGGELWCLDCAWMAGEEERR